MANYFGYFKLERSGSNYITVSYSDDKVTWFPFEQCQLAASTLNGYWAPHATSSEGNSITTTVNLELEYSGFSDCCASPSSVCKVDSSPVCENPPAAFVECSANQWRMAILASELYVAPTITITATQIVMNVGLRSDIPTSNNDNYLFNFKQVTGDGSLIVFIDSMGQSGQRYAGLMFQNIYTTNTIVTQRNVFTCTVPDQGNLVQRARKDGTGVELSSVSVNMASNRIWLKITKSGDSFSCFYSFNNPKSYTYLNVPWIQTSQTFTYSGLITGSSYYAGLIHFAGQNGGSVTLQDVAYVGFTGYCSNRGDCAPDGSRNIDKCICNSGYSGTTCELTSCNGILSSNPSVCNSRGTCVGPNQCNCQTGYTGQYCQIPICYGILGNNTNVCSSKGTCISADNCNCLDGYGSNNCGSPICYGILSTDPSVCSFNGTCSAPDNCTCKTGYGSNDCSLYSCNGKLSTNPTVCSGNGNCLGPNTCTCKPGYGGTDCQFFECNGKLSNNPTACSGNGTCSGPSTCTCTSGYGGTDCHFFECNGKLSNNPTVCSGNGTCNGPNTCTCISGYGSSDCSLFRCSSRNSNDPLVCSGNGLCSSPNTCVCNLGYGSANCSIFTCQGVLATNPSVCSGKGTCSGPNTCSCQTGYGSTDCSQPICYERLLSDPLVCSANGVCSSPNNCTCNTGFGRNNCSDPICYGRFSSDLTVCTSNGICSSPNNCTCKPGFLFEQCQVTSCSGILSNQSNVCSSQGVCTSLNNCVCNSTYQGSDCQFPICNGLPSNNPTVCSGNGNCTLPNVCICKNGYKGANCQTVHCDGQNGCSGKGTCTGPATCTCNAGYTGSNCTIPICNSKLSTDPTVCTSRGACVSPNNCSCFSAGFTGSDCQSSACSTNCTFNGLCLGPNLCSCYPGWMGTACDTFNCFNVANCSTPKGSCVGPNTCSCTPSWSGSDCSSPVCYNVSALSPTVCSSRGNCSNPNLCDCQTNNNGLNCEFTSCFGINSSNPLVCSSNGKCNSFNSCQCNPGYNGNQCQFTICNGVSSNFSSVCSGNGNCTNPDVCNCTSQYTGSNCQNPLCYGISSVSPSVCSSRGTCIGPNSCSCNSGYTGNQCEHTLCFGVSSALSTVCSGKGLCSSPNVCQCRQGIYGTNCENSILWDFVSVLCNTTQGCTLNMTNWQICTKQSGPSCYCYPNSTINTATESIQCDGSERITSIRIINRGIATNLPNMKSFTSLVSLDLSFNPFKIGSPISSLLPLTILNINFTGSQLSNAAELMEINQFNLNSFTLNNNQICGVYPYSFIGKSQVTFTGHSSSIWCSSLNTVVPCGPLPITSPYVVLPHETTIPLTISSVSNTCKYYLQSQSLGCQARALNNTVKNFNDSSVNLVTNTVVCDRSGLFPSDIDQSLFLTWKYNNTLFERVSTIVSIVNLPYVTIQSMDRQLIYSNGSGFQTVIIGVDQNITRYRKDPSQPALCRITPDNYFVPAISVSVNGRTFTCQITLSTPNLGPKTITLFDSSSQFQISSNSIQFLLFDLKLPTDSYQPYSSNSNPSLRNSLGYSIPTLNPSYNYTFRNSLLNINFTCVVSGGNLTQYSKTAYTFPVLDYSVQTMELYENSQIIAYYPIVFFRKDNFEIYPALGIADGTIQQFYLRSESVSLLINSPGLSIALRRNPTYFLHTYVNNRTVSYNLSRTSHESLLTYRIVTVYSNNDDNEIGISNNSLLPITWVIRSNITPRGPIVFFQTQTTFNFTFARDLPFELQSQFECRSSNGFISNVTMLTPYSYSCPVSFTSPTQSITLWFRDKYGTSQLQLSLNSIEISYINLFANYTSSSKQLGYVNNVITTELDFAFLPTNYTSRVYCQQNGITVTSNLISGNDFYCNISSNTVGFSLLTLGLSVPNTYFVDGILDTFYYGYTVRISNASTILNTTGSYVQFILNTQKLISEGKMRSDCRDLVATYKGVRINRLCSPCNNPASTLAFNIQESIPGNTINLDYKFYHGTYSVNPPSQATISTIRLLNPDVLELNFDAESTVQTNPVTFTYVEMSPVLSYDPLFALVTNTTMNIMTTYTTFNYGSRLSYLSSFNSLLNPATLSNQVFTTNISSLSSIQTNLTILARLNTTGEQLPITQSFIFTFTSKINLISVFPFVDKFNLTQTSISRTIQITSQSNILTSQGLKCKVNFKGTISYFDATLLNPTLVQCDIIINGLSLNSETAKIDLYLNISSNPSSNFDLSQNSLTYYLLKDPVSFLFPSQFISNGNFLQNFTLNITDPSLFGGEIVSYSNYSIVLTSSSISSQTLTCFRTINPRCSISPFTTTLVPTTLDFTLTFRSPYYPNVATFTMNPILYIERVDVLTETPFVSDTRQNIITPLDVRLSLGRNLNPSYNYSCLVFSREVPAVRNAPNDYRCSFNTRGFIENANITLLINNTTFQSSNILSTQDAQVFLTSLILSPSSTELNETISIDIQQNTTSYTLPTKYRSLVYTLTDESSVNLPCTVNSGIIRCTKSKLNPFTQDILTRQMKLRANGTDITFMSRSFLFYERNNLINISPLAALSNSNVNVTLTFETSTLNRNLLESHNVLCQAQGTTWIGTVSSNTAFTCLIVFNQHNQQLLDINAQFSVPSLNATVNISMNTQKITYLNQSPVYLDSSQPLFFLVGSPSVYSPYIDQPVTQNIANNFACKITGYNPTSSNFSSRAVDRLYYNCSFNILDGGKKQFSIVYKESNTEFQISNNTIEVVYAKIGKIQSFSPLAVVANISQVITVFTNFENLDYGQNVTFKVKYGLNTSRYANETVATMFNGFFQFNILWQGVPGDILYISLWMNAKGIEKNVVSEEYINVLDSNYFTPSYGTPSGGETLTIISYTSVNTNVTFNSSSLNGLIFRCNTSNSQLVCITPSITPNALIPIYSSKTLKFVSSGVVLSSAYIFYEKRVISLYSPQVVPTNSPFKLNVTMDKAINMTEGTMFYVLGSRSINEAKYDLGKITNKQNISQIVSSITNPDVYPFELFYYNTNSLELASMFSITSKVNITAITPTNLVLVSGNNLIYINTPSQITVKLESTLLSSIQKTFVKCIDQNDQILTTIYQQGTDDYQCTLSSSSPLIGTVSLWYVNSDALDGRVIVSRFIDVIFIRKLTLSQILPIASLASSQLVSLNTSISSDLYSSKANYLCYHNGSYYSASLSQNVFQCGISKKFAQAYASNISIVLQSQQYTNNYIDLTDGLIFYFLNQIDISSITPLGVQSQIQNQNQLVTINLLNPILLSQGLMCSMDNTRLSPIIMISSTQVDCNISKTSFSSSVDTIDISLFYNLTQTQFSLTSNSLSFVFARTPLLWNNTKAINGFSPLQLLAAVPSSFNYEVTMMVNSQPVILLCSLISNLPTCNLAQNDLASLIDNPSTLNINYTLNRNGISLTLITDSLIYYTSTSIQHLKPLIFAFKQQLYKPLRIILNTRKRINSQYQYLCLISQFSLNVTSPVAFDVTSNELQVELDALSHFSCSFKSFGSSNSYYNISLIYLSPNESIILTQPVPITVIDTPSLDRKIGPNTGLTSTGASLSLFNDNPTPGYNNYSITLRLYDRDTSIIFNDCQFFIQCNTPNILSIYKDWKTTVRKFRVDLFFNNVFALSFSPFFTFYESMSSVSILPSPNLLKGRPYTLYFNISGFDFQDQLSLMVVSPFQQILAQASISQKDLIKSDPISIIGASSVEFRLSLNGFNYISIGTLAQAFDPFIILSSSTTTLSVLARTELYIFGQGFFSTSTSIVRLTDNSVNIQVTPTFINSTTLLAIIPPFYDLGVSLPRSLQLSISIDAGIYYIDAPFKLKVPELAPVSIQPALIPRNILTQNLRFLWPEGSIYVKPTFSLKINMSNIHNNTEISVPCLADYSSCSINLNPTFITTYKFRFYLVSSQNEWKEVLISSNNLKIYNFPSISSFTPEIIMRKSSKPLMINGDFSEFSTATLRLRENALLSTLMIPATGSKQSLSAPVPSSIPSSSYSLEITFNGEFYHQTSMNYSVIDTLTISSIINPDNVKNPNNLFSFVNSNVTLRGTNFINSKSIVQLRMSNGYINTDITSLSPLTIVSSTEIRFRAPLINLLGFNYQLNYPVQMSLDLSLNGGYDFVSIPFFYVDTYPLPTYTSLLPLITPRKELNLTLFGLNLDLVGFISVYSPSNLTIGAEIYESSKYVSLSDNNIIFTIPPFDVSLRIVKIFLKNAQRQRASNSLDLIYYDVPIINSITPLSGPTVSTKVTLFGEKFLEYPIFSRFAGLDSPVPCTFSSNTSLSCLTPNVPPGNASISLSYNRIDWHQSSIYYTFDSCPEGYGAKDHTQLCTLCPPGTYKPTSGVYSCFNCRPDTYSQFAGSLSCEKCPTNTTTNGTFGSSSHKDCVCSPGFYMNTDLSNVQNAVYKCIECPFGGNCDTVNTTIPLARSGFWYDETDWTSFAACLPSVSCPGGGFNNCTDGYTGLRCGVCSRNYYRFKKYCEKCGDITSSWLRLLGIVLLVGIVTIIFFALSSTKVSHISSIAIAFSFGQVLSMFAKFDIIWPSTISGTLTGASVITFNIDFLSPSCIFPNMNYYTLWLLQMLLPVFFLVSFCLLYLFLILRSVFAGITGSYLKPKYWKPYVLEEEDEEDSEKKQSKVKKLLNSILTFIKETTIFIRNFTVWFFTEKSTMRDFGKILNKIINSYFAFLSFSFIFIMTTASTVFVCKRQTNGKWTLNESPDIICFQDSVWWLMTPLTILWYIIFGFGSFVYFLIIWLKFKDWSKNTDFNERNKFMLSRFKKKFYFWEAVVTLRKTILSIIYIFFKPMLVIVSGILLLFLGFLIHIHFVPFKRKFHNIMDYFIILVTMGTLFFGLLFYVNKWPDIDSKGYSGLKVFSEWLVFILIILSCVIVVLMILWDSLTRRRKDKQRERKKLRKIIEKEAEEIKLKNFLLDLHDTTEEISFIDKQEMPWDVEFDYKPITFKTESESSEEESMTMNEIFEDLISTRRVKRKLNSISKKITKTIHKIKSKEKDEKIDKKQKEILIVKEQMEEEKRQKSEQRKVKEKSSNVGVRLIKKDE